MKGETSVLRVFFLFFLFFLIYTDTLIKTRSLR